MLIYLVLAGLAGGFINGLAGFGTALFALGFLLQILPPVQAVGLVLVLSVISGCLLYTSPSPRDRSLPRMPSSA